MREIVTVFTPTYNRGYILSNLYGSLVRQTDKRFVWMIINDGSTDNTDGLVEKWMSEGMVNIIYIKQKNNGKPFSMNLSIEKSDTDLWVCVDSDDYLSDDAIELATKYYEDIRDNDKICGMLALRTRSNGTIKEKNVIPDYVKFSKLRDLANKYKVKEETVIFFKTFILKNFKFPIFWGEKFMPEGYIYTQIDQRYYYKVLKESLYFYKYLPDGITSSNGVNLIKNNYRGYILTHKQSIIWATGLKNKIANIIFYNWGHILGIDRNFVSAVKCSPAKILTVLLYPISIFTLRKRL